jgi:hypothetical protein
MKKFIVLTSAAVLCLALAVPAWAKVHVGGIVFLDAYYHRLDKDAATNLLGLGWGPNDSDDWQQLEIEVPNITRLYASWSTDDSDVGMYIEIGLGGANSEIVLREEEPAPRVILRHAYGWWKIHPMVRLLVGQTDGSFATLNPDQMLGTNSMTPLGTHVIGIGFGNLYESRVPQIRLEVTPNDMVAVKFSVLDNRATDTLEISGNEENVWPRFDIIVPMNFGPLYLEPGFSWAKAKIDEGKGWWENSFGAQEIEKSFYVWAAALGLRFTYGPFTLTAEGAIGENWAAGSFTGPFPADHPLGDYLGPELDVSGDYEEWEFRDSEDIAFFFDLAYKIGPATIHAIYGYQETELFYGYWSPGWPDYEGELQCVHQMYGISVPIVVAKIFIIRPELFFYDWGKADYPDWAAWASPFPWDSVRDVPFGHEIVGGIQFQVEF